VYVETRQLPATGHFSSSRLPQNESFYAKSNMKKVRVLWDVTQCGLAVTDVSKERSVFIFRVQQSLSTKYNILNGLSLYKHHYKNYKSLNMRLLSSWLHHAWRISNTLLSN